ncbi:MAG: hypothetical protein JSV61_04855 [Anaerolineales bacterium]|nr:MAG: hypothetical protein JSV61_04855 [Anaerolineales bacterium]
MKTQKRILLIWSIALLTAGLLLFGSLINGSQTERYLGLLLFSAFLVVGGSISTRQPKNAIGWFFLAGVFIHALNGFLSWYARVGLQERPASLPAAGVVAALINGMGNFGFGLLLFFPFLLFPNGRLLSRRWRPIAWLTGLILAMQVVEIFRPGPLAFFHDWENPLGVGWLAGYFEISDALSEVLFSVVFLACTLSLILRYRRATLTERQQIKWLAYAAGLIGLVVGLMLVLSPILDLMQIAEIWFNLIWITLVTSIPVSIGLAILRYRLYDIDLIIRRTLVYTVLTATLGLVYFGMVILLEGVLRSLVGSSGQVATVVSTLAIAALFTPLRRRVQDTIDRRFYRRKYNAEQALAGFAAASRNETDLEALSAQVVNIVQNTMQPDQVSLWLKVSENQ